jgi:serine protease Do
MMHYFVTLLAITAHADCNTQNFDKVGKLDGYKCSIVEPGSQYDKLGLKNGDVITQVNGKKINNPKTASRILGKLKSSRSTNIRVKRDGEEKDLNSGKN